MTTPSVTEIESRISSSDLEILHQCLRFVDERLAKEGERTRSAEVRGTAMLALIGAAAAFLVHIADKLPSVSWNLAEMRLSIILYIFAVLFLIKSIYYAIQTLGTVSQFRMEVDSIYEMQPLSETDALRKEIAGKIWEFKMSVFPNTRRLHQLQRCQRSLIFVVIFLVLVGYTLLLTQDRLAALEPCVSVVAIILSILLLFGADAIFERRGIWQQPVGTVSY